MTIPSSIAIMAMIECPPLCKKTASLHSATILYAEDGVII